MNLTFPRLAILSHTQVDYSNQLCRPLVGVKGSRNPHVAVVTGISDRCFAVAPRSGRAQDEALIAQATATTRSQKWSWTVAEESGILFWKKPSMLRGMGDPMLPIRELETDGGGIDDLPTELLLIPAAMAEAHQTLRSSTLFCIVPKRGWLLVTRGEVGNPFAAENLHQAAAGIASRGGRSAIAGDVVLIMQDGKLTGVDGRDKGSGYISMQGENEANWWPD